MNVLTRLDIGETRLTHCGLMSPYDIINFVLSCSVRSCGIHVKAVSWEDLRYHFIK